MHRMLLLGFIIFSALPFFPHPANASHLHEQAVHVEILDANGNITASIYPFPDTYRGDASIAVADLGQDGTEEVLIGSGHGISPTVYVYRQDGSKIGEFLAYDASYGNGVTVTACDVNGDGINEIVTGTLYGGGPQVRVFNNMGEAITPGFFAYDEAFRGGANVACGDVDADGTAEIITAPGRTGGPHIKVFSETGILKAEIFAGGADEGSGGYVWVKDGTIQTARVVDGATSKTTYRYTNGSLVYVTAEETTSSVRPDTFSLSAQKTAHLVMPQTTHLFPEDLAGTASGERILIDLSEQTLYAYENGAFVRGFLVSTGVPSHPTPVGQTTVTDKLLWHDYSWYYGPGDPDNYNLPNVEYNLRIYTHIYIHSAYWHHNFGHVMSHGCINTALDDAAWIFSWAQVGTIVDIVE